jgi:hypothetical protein
MDSTLAGREECANVGCRGFANFEVSSRQATNGIRLGKLQHHLGIEPIRLGPLQQGFGKVGNGAWVGYHDLGSLGPVQSQGQIKAIKTGGLNANTDDYVRLFQLLDQRLVPGCRVGKLVALATWLVVAFDRHHQRVGTDIDSDKDQTNYFGHQKAPFLRLGLRFP